MRRLLPYEHQLIESLGISKEEYLEFVAVQQEYKDPKVGTTLDVRNEVTSTTALVLTVVGILFQVGAALLAPKPEIPDIQARNRRRNREQRFAPTFGFNSTQELASYGDPVNLVYTNQNDKGNVRVAGSLVWSAIENFGSTQFMQLIIALGASQIKLIDYSKIAFGQISMKDLNRETVFVFGKENGAAGPPLFGDIKHDDLGGADFFPTSLKPGNDRPACLVVTYGTDGNKQLGFSQAYTPSTSTSFGVFDAVPINVDVKARNEKGKERSAPVNIVMPGNLGNNNVWKNRTNTNATFLADQTVVFKFNAAKNKDGDKEARDAAVDLRRQTLEALDFGSTYMLGTAKFRLTGYNDASRDIEKNEVFPVFTCIQGGYVPTADYARVEPRTNAPGTKAELEKAQEILRNDPVTNEEGEEDLSTLPRSDNVVATDTELGIDIVFNSTREVEWTNAYTGQITESINEKGSIAYSEREQKRKLAKPPVLSDKEARKALADRIDELQLLLDEITGGSYDLDPGKYEESVGDQPAGRKKDSKVNFTDNKTGYQFIGYDKEHLTGTPFRPDGKMPYNLWYVGVAPVDDDNVVTGEGTNYFFWFTGVTKAKEGTDNPKFFPDDSKLSDLRDALSDAKRLKDDLTSASDSLGERLTKITDDSLAPDQDTGDRTGRKLVLNIDTFLAIYETSGETVELDEKIADLREQINERVANLLNQQHAEARRIIKNDIKTLKERREAIPAGEDIPDANGAFAYEEAYEQLIQDKKNALLNIDDILGDWETYTDGLDNNFFVKCLVKAETASYDTLNACNSVKFSLKSRVFRRISGRQKKYAEQKVKEYSASDNGVKSRMAFFRVFFKKITDETFEFVPVLFAIRRGSEADFYTQLNFYSVTQHKWQFKFEPVFDVRAENEARSFNNYAIIENTTNTAEVDIADARFTWFGKTVAANTNTQFPNEEERGPALTNEWDMFSVNSDTQVQFSFESGPEIALTAVTEQQIDGSYKDKYSNMTMMALGIFAGRGIQDLRSVTALVTHGKLCRTVETPDTATASSSYAPDIFVDTVLDEENGIGKYVDVISVDTESLEIAKKFCTSNKLPLHDAEDDETGIELFMDGIIADVGSWREFWINAAPFSLLELARKNGIDTLVPALPCNEAGEAAEDNGLPIEFSVSALFTTGNILEDSFKEEYLNYGTATEDIIASVIYREYNKDELFSQKKSVDIKLRKGLSDTDTAIRETFDLSQFVTQREQAIMFGKLLCNQRRYIRKGIEFQTFPSEAVIAPGDFIYVDVGMEDWDKYSAGVIMEGGALNSPLLDTRPDGTYQFLIYKGQTGETQSFDSVSVSDGIASDLSDYKGWMFVMGTKKPQKRVYRITELSIEEEGEVSVKALEYPCFESGNDGKLRARIADFRATNFEVS